MFENDGIAFAWEVVSLSGAVEHHPSNREGTRGYKDRYGPISGQRAVLLTRIMADPVHGNKRHRTGCM